MRKLYWGLFLVGALLTNGLAEKGDKAKVEELLVEPSELVFASPGEARRILVTGVTGSGERVDLTSSAQLRPLDSIAELEDEYFVRATRSGRGKIAVTAAGHTVNVAVDVGSPETLRPVTFLKDVLPIINKVGCTQGTCHGAAKGKNGFKLSLRGYDPEFDYQSLLYDMSGRRFNRAAPERKFNVVQAYPGGSPWGWTTD